MSTNIETVQHLVDFKDFQNLDEFDRYCDDISTGKVQIIKLYGNNTNTNTTSTTAINKLIEAIGNSPRNRLCRLELHNYPLKSNGCVRLILALENKLKLGHVALNGCQISNDGAKAIAIFLKENKSVIQFSVNNNDIGSDGGQALAESITHNNNLESLSITQNKLGVEGVRALLNTLKNSASLREIELQSNELSLHQVLELCVELGKREISEKYQEQERAAAAAEQQSMIEAQSMLQAGQGQAPNPLQGVFSSILSSLGAFGMGASVQIRATRDAKLALEELTKSIITDRNSTLDEKDVAAHEEPEEKVGPFEGARALTRISSMYIQCLHNGEEQLKQEQFDAATQSFKQACELASTNLQLADCHTKIGETYMMRYKAMEIGKSTKLAVDEFKKSIELQKREGLDKQHPDRVKNETLIIQCKSQFNWHNASVFDRKNDFVKAIKQYTLAANTFLSIGSISEAASCYLNAAIACCKPSINNLELATKLCRQAKSALQSERQTSVGIPLTPDLKKDLNLELDKTETLIQSLQANADQLHREQLEEKLNPTCEENYKKGVSHFESGKFELAIASFNTAQEYATIDEQRADCYSSRGSCYLRLSQFNLAETEFKKSLTLLRKTLSKDHSKIAEEKAKLANCRHQKKISAAKSAYIRAEEHCKFHQYDQAATCFESAAEYSLETSDMHNASVCFYNAVVGCMNIQDYRRAHYLCRRSKNAMGLAYTRERGKFAPGEYQQRMAQLNQINDECLQPHRAVTHKEKEYIIVELTPKHFKKNHLSDAQRWSFARSLSGKIKSSNIKHTGFSHEINHQNGTIKIYIWGAILPTTKEQANAFIKEIENHMNTFSLGKTPLRDLYHVNQLLTPRAEDSPVSPQEQQKLSAIFSRFKLTGDTDNPDLINKALRRASGFGDSDDIFTLIEAGAFINAKDNNPQKGLTALHWALDEGKYPNAEKLLNFGARIDIQDNKNRTALGIINSLQDNEKKERLLKVCTLVCPEQLPNLSLMENSRDTSTQVQRENTEDVAALMSTLSLNSPQSRRFNGANSSSNSDETTSSSLDSYSPSRRPGAGI